MKNKLHRLVMMFVASIFAVGAWAQTDVTNQYLTNAGFDDETSFVTNGICTYAKDCSANGTTLSGMQPVNGWTFGVTNGDALASGAYAWGAPHFLGGSDYTIPATSESGNSTGGALGICAVWNASLYYYQDITLPSGVYEFTYSVYNSGTGANTIDANLFGFVADDGSSYCGKKNTFTANSWTTETVSFVLTAETKGKISVGIDAANAGSGSSHHLFVDGVKLIYNGEFGEVSPENPLDVTGKVGTSKDAWHAPGGPVTIDGISMPENFQESSATLGDVLWQKVEGLENGKYTVELWANARVAWRDSPATNGQNELTYLFANNVEKSIAVLLNPNLDSNTSHVLEGVIVTDGTLKMGMTKKAAGSNWHTIQIKSLLYLGEDLTALKSVFLAKWAEFDAYSKESLNSSWAAINESCFWTVHREAKALADKADSATAAAMEGMMAKMDEAIASIEAAYVVVDKYGKVASLFGEVLENSAVADEETCEAAVSIYQAYSSKAFMDSVSTVKGIEEAVAKLDAAYRKYVFNALPTEEYMFDLTFMVANAEVSSTNGWENAGAASGEQYTGAPDNTYLDWCRWDWTGNSFNMSQEIAELPLGFYTLKAATRSHGKMDASIYAGEFKTSIHKVGNSGNELGGGWGWTTIENVKVLSGKLTIGFTGTAPENGVWAGADNFKLYYTGVPDEGFWATDEQKQAFVAAIAEAEANHVIGFAKDEYAPYTNVEAVKTLLDARAVDLERAAAEYLEILQEALKAAVWTANTEEMPIIYNGNFAEVTEGANYPNGWTRTNAWGEMRTNVADCDKGTAYYNHPGSLVYGSTGAYIMPLSASGIYKLTFKYRSHEDGSNKGVVVSILCGESGLEKAEFEANGSKTEWKTAEVEFTAEVSGNYVLTLANSGNTWLTDVSLVRVGTDMTGVENSEIRNEKSDVIFDLQGRRIQKMEKGLYIVNGRKVLVK